MLDISELNSSLAFWDAASYVVLTAVFVGVVGESVVELTSWIKNERLKSFVARASTLLLIAGLGSEIMTDAKIREYTDKITAILHAEASSADERAGKAEERAGEAYQNAADAIFQAEDAKRSAAVANRDASVARKEAEQARERAEVARRQSEDLNLRAVGLEKIVEDLRAANLKLQTDGLKMEAELRDARQKGKATETRVSSVEEKIADRIVDDDQRESIVHKLHGHRRPVLIVRLDDAEPRSYADSIAAALKAAHYSVRQVDFGHSSPATGVIVCSNGVGALKLFQVLKMSEIATEFRRSATDIDENRPAECQADGFFQPPGQARGAYRIFVGQKPQVTD